MLPLCIDYISMERLKMLVTGSQGFLGSRIAQYYADEMEVTACNRQNLDISNAEQVMQVFRTVNPDVVIHCAAVSDTGYAQNHPEESYRVNVQGSLNIAQGCAEVGAKMIYMSSDQVYNGTKRLGLLPEDAVCPINVYGCDKLEAEKQVAEVLPDAVGLRLTWMYDLPTSPLRLNSNILVNLKNAYDAGNKLNVAVREYRGITNVWDVVKKLHRCMMLPGGVYNYGSENVMNTYETFIQAAQGMGLPNPETWIIKDEERFKEHPRNLSIDISKIRGYNIDFPSTSIGLIWALS